MSVYKVIEIIGTSTESWEDAGLTAVKKARETIRNLRVAEVLEQDLDLDDGGGATFRTKLRVSFKYEDEGSTPHPAHRPPATAPDGAGHTCRLQACGGRAVDRHPRPTDGGSPRWHTTALGSRRSTTDSTRPTPTWWTTRSCSTSGSPQP